MPLGSGRRLVSVPSAPESLPPSQWALPSPKPFFRNPMRTTGTDWAFPGTRNPQMGVLQFSKDSEAGSGCLPGRGRPNLMLEGPQRHKKRHVAATCHGKDITQLQVMLFKMRMRENGFRVYIEFRI